VSGWCGGDGEPKPSAAQLLLEDPILFSQVVENALLMAVEAAGDRQDQEVERRCCVLHGSRTLSPTRWERKS